MGYHFFLGEEKNFSSKKTSLDNCLSLSPSLLNLKVNNNDKIVGCNCHNNKKERGKKFIGCVRTKSSTYVRTYTCMQLTRSLLVRRACSIDKKNEDKTHLGGGKGERRKVARPI